MRLLRASAEGIGMGHPFYFNIDVLGSCNLRCPSCPQGNSRNVALPTGFMDPDLLRQIMAKATAECQVAGVGLFNWTEPLLHPKLPELVSIVQSYGVPCALSSNLNFIRNVDALLATNPDSFRISTSAFTQSLYSRTHAGGDIEIVKANMRELAEAKRRTGSTTRIHVLYHRYLGNLDDEALMKAYSQELSFEFIPVWAYMMPLEKVLAFVEHQESHTAPDARQPTTRRRGRLNILAEPAPAPTFTTEDSELVARLALPIDGALKASRRYANRPCALRDNQMTIDFEGNVQLCCATFDSSRYTLAPFLTLPHDKLQAKKYEHDACTKCMDNGIHVYFTYAAPEFDTLATARIARRYRQLGLDFSQGVVRQNLKRIVSNLKHEARGAKHRLGMVRDRLLAIYAGQRQPPAS